MLHHMQAKIRQLQTLDLNDPLQEDSVEPIRSAIFALKQATGQRADSLSSHDQSDLWAAVCDLWVQFPQGAKVLAICLQSERPTSRPFARKRMSVGVCGCSDLHLHAGMAWY